MDRGMEIHRLRLARQRRLMTQRDLAHKSKVSHRTIYNIEAGLRVPRASTRRKLLKALRIPYARQEEVFGTPPLN